jgi:NAD+-dependent secondary alcohol dehydrogenase Adh1
VASRLGADETVQADGSHVDKVLEMTDGRGAEVVLDFVGERGAEKDGWNMTGADGSHHIIGYGGTVEIPTIDIISTERNVIGNLVGTYNDLAELMTLQSQGKVSLQTSTYSLDAINDAINDLNNGRIPGGRGILIPEGAAA